MLLKAKMTICLMLTNACINIVLLALDGKTINKTLNLKEDEDSILNLQKEYQTLGVQLSSTEKKNTPEALTISAGFSICNSMAVIVMSIVMTICLVKCKSQNIQLAITLGITGGISFILVIPKAIYTQRIGTEVDLTQVETDYDKQRISLLNKTNINLSTEYTSDIISPSRNTLSDKWNLFFLKNKCCAVNPVKSTTNDFDFTPWCTTSGSCQQTNSAIPKTCCKNVTEDNYTLADRSCHQFVSPGTYHKEGCASIWTNNPHSSSLKQAKDDMYKYQISATTLEFVSGGISLFTILMIYFWQHSDNKSKYGKY